MHPQELDILRHARLGALRLTRELEQKAADLPDSLPGRTLAEAVTRSASRLAAELEQAVINSAAQPQPPHES